ncbi:hypothetical protein R9J48_05520, partial [Escherichia coli]
PSISDGRLSYQFSSDGYIRRSVYAYDFSFITTIKNGKVTGMRHVAKGEHLMTFDAFKEIAERAGYLVIHSDNLRSMTLDKLMVMGKKSAISVANSAF